MIDLALALGTGLTAVCVSCLVGVRLWVFGKNLLR